MRTRRTSSRSVVTDTHAVRFQQLKSELAKIDYFSKGTVLARRVKCGKPQCACSSDPSKRHGPYYQWTYEAGGKTVNVRLNAETAPLIHSAAKQYRKVKSIMTRLEKVSRQALAKLVKDALQCPPN